MCWHFADRIALGSPHVCRWTCGSLHCWQLGMFAAGFCAACLSSVSCAPMSGAAGSCGRFTCKLSKKLPHCFPKWPHPFTAPPATRGPISPQPAHPQPSRDVKRRPVDVLSPTSHTTDGVRQLSLCLLATCVSSLERCLSNYAAHFLKLDCYSNCFSVI